MSGSFYPSALLNNLLCGYTCVIWPTYFNCRKTVYCMSESQFVFPSFQPRALVCFPCLITNTVSVNTLRRGWLFVSVCRNSLQDKCLQWQRHTCCVRFGFSRHDQDALWRPIYVSFHQHVWHFSFSHILAHIWYGLINFFFFFGHLQAVTFLVVICTFLFATVLGRVIYTFWMLVLCDFKCMANISPASEVFI